MVGAGAPVAVAVKAAVCREATAKLIGWVETTGGVVAALMVNVAVSMAVLPGGIDGQSVNGVGTHTEAGGGDRTEGPGAAVCGALPEQLVGVGLQAGRAVRFKEELHVCDGGEDVAAVVRVLIGSRGDRFADVGGGEGNGVACGGGRGIACDGAKGGCARDV